MATSEQLDAQQASSQVRIQLTSRDAELQIPQETGPILCSTSKAESINNTQRMG